MTELIADLIVEVITAVCKAIWYGLKKFSR